MQVLRIDPEHGYWQAMIAHLTANGDAVWVLDESGLPKDDKLIFLCAAIGEKIVGNLTMRRQPVVIPASDWAGDRDRHLRDTEGGLIDEMFVQTFTVEEAFRRKGIGRALQEEGLRQTKAEDCYQMHSWSSMDKKDNYRLKMEMGFGFHPELQETASGLKVSGGYFVKVV